MDAKKYPLIIGLLIPVLMVIVIALSVSVPRMFAPPATYDFIYSASDGYSPAVEYSVKGNRIISIDRKDPSRPPEQMQYAPVALYRYFVKENRSEIISPEEAAGLSLSGAQLSPDKFMVGPGTGGSSFLFFYSSYTDHSAMYLKGHGVEYKLNLVPGRNYYAYNNFRFIGWVLP